MELCIRCGRRSGSRGRAKRNWRFYVRYVRARGFAKSIRITARRSVG